MFLPESLLSKVYFGMTATAELVLKPNSNLYSLPKSAIHYDNGKYWIEILDSNKHIIKKNVALKEISNEFVGIEELNVGDCVVIPS